MIKTLIVDDERLARQRIRRLLQNETDLDIVGECKNGAEAVSFINQNKIDLVFLDIQMPQLNGFEVLEQIKAPQIAFVIFVTAFDSFAIKAFEFHALDYLLKPFTPERLQTAVAHAREFLTINQTDNFHKRVTSLLTEIRDVKLREEKKYAERVMLRSAGRIYFIQTNAMSWIEAQGNYVNLHVGKEEHLLRETMSNLEKRLDPTKFVRIHRSAIVNVESVFEIRRLLSGDYSLILKDKTELVLSRHYRDSFFKLSDDPDKPINF